MNFDAFMVIRSSPSPGNLAENSNFKRSSFSGAEQGWVTTVTVYQYEPSSDVKYPWGIQMPTRENVDPSFIERPN